MIYMKIMSFQSYVIDLHKTHNYSLSHTGSMDETSTHFYLPSNNTMDSVRAKSVAVKSTGHQKQASLQYRTETNDTEVCETRH